MRDRVTEEILIMLLPLVERGHPVEFILSPSHCGILRNEAADEEAVMARSLPQEGIPIWHVEFLTAVKRLCWEDVQEEAEGAYTARQAPFGVASTLFLVLTRASNRVFAQGAMRHLPSLRQACMRPADHKEPFCVGGAVPLTLRRRIHPDRLRNLHLACPRHLLVERQAADQRRPAQSVAESSRPSTIWRYTPDAPTLALQSLQKTSHVDSATAPPYSQEVPHAQVTTENVKRINEQKTDSAPPQAPMTAVALQPLRYGNPHQPLSPRQSTGGPAAHAAGMHPSSTTEHPTIWEHSLSHDSGIQERKNGHISTDGPQNSNEQWLQSMTKWKNSLFLITKKHHLYIRNSHSMNSLRTTALSCNTSWYHPAPLSTH
ncbi:regulator of sigma E protease [Trypanosoma cruzi]|nr:regulator of sigma E protease [Trypanosoma cruzi]